MSTSTPAPTRLNYLDQFRGYTVFGMIVVNFLGDFRQNTHPLFHHHNTYCSYADTIMPQFFFAVGFALRYTMVKRLQTEGWLPAHLRIVRRVLALLMIAAIVHGFDKLNANWETLTREGFFYWITKIGSREFFQTLTHIAFATLWVLPVIGQRWPIRLLWLLGSMALHIWCSHEFYLRFALDRPVIDGGPLGFLTWSIPVMSGSFASDFLTKPGQRAVFVSLLGMAILVMGLGYGLSCLQILPTRTRDIADQPVNTLVLAPVFELTPPPFMPPEYPKKPNATYQERHSVNKYDVITLWTMSQQTGSVSYLVFGTGFSLLVLAVCMLLFGQTRSVPLFRALGSNALVAYIIHGMTIDAVAKVMPKDAPLWVVLIGLSIVIGITWLICAWLDKRGWYVRV